jgi:hypothetical protein
MVLKTILFIAAALGIAIHIYGIVLYNKDADSKADWLKSQTKEEDKTDAKYDEYANGVVSDNHSGLTMIYVGGGLALAFGIGGFMVPSKKSGSSLESDVDSEADSAEEKFYYF